MLNHKFTVILSLFIYLTSCSQNNLKDVTKSDPARTLVRQSIKAHGGIDTWRSKGVLKFRWAYHMSDLGKVVDTTQIVDIKSMDAIHQAASSETKFGRSQGKYWISPQDATFTPPAKFWTLTPIYFLGIPFIFEDDNANFEMLSEDKEFDGKSYEQVKITYDASAGDSPDDYYVLLIDPTNKLTKGAYYTVTNPLVNKTGEVVEKFISLDDLKDIKGVKLSSGHTTYKMDSGIIGKKMRYTVVSEVEFLSKNDVDFSIPSEAKVIE